MFFFLGLVKNQIGSNVSINLQTHIDPFLQIGTVYFSVKLPETMYVSAKWSDNTVSIKKYNISNSQFILLKTYLNFKQNIIYDSILEINSAYIAVYK